MRSVLLLSLITGLGLFSSNAQPITKSTYDATIQTAEEKLAQQDYYNALVKYEEAYEEKSDRSLTLTIANLHYQIRDYTKAERWYTRLFRRDKNNQFAEDRFLYGRLLKMNGKYEKAIEELQRFITETKNDTLRELAQYELTGAEIALEMPDNTKGVTIENAGKTVNSKTSEYSPVFSKDGKELYFSSFQTDSVIIVDEKNTDYHTKIYRSTKEEKGWSKPKALDQKINRPAVHTSNVSFSSDGRIMFFTRSVLEGNVPRFSKIFFSIRGDSDWGAANEVAGINGDYIAKHAAAGELFGREVLFFVSNMEGGYGGFDVYYATRKGDGVYADPVNLGPKINTPGDEETPFYRDGTLYFSSTGHPGIGGFDIFYSVWNGSIWSEPTNMGKGYNTSVDDHFFSLDDKGYNGFLTSNRPGGRSVHGKTCCDDIYSFNIAELYAELVVGVFDEKKKPLLAATVQVIEFQNNTQGAADSKTIEKGNRFDFPLSLEMPYKVIASREGYFPDTTEFNTVGLTESKSYEHRFYLKAKPVPQPEPEYDTITIEEPIVLENILYDFDQDRIKEESESDLLVVMELMDEYPEMKIELGSHTDIRGIDEYNKDLAQRRAESARRWLVRNGISRVRIEAKGYGESVPQTVSKKVATQYDFLKEGDILTEEFINNLTAEEQKETAHYINRRTEFKILEGPTSIIIKHTRLRKKTSGKALKPGNSKSKGKKKQ